jgi:RNA polymerase primary sigma factor
MDAIYKYDPSFETQFSTYAFFWIKQRIQRFLVYNQSTLKIPAHAGEIIYARKVIKNENPDLTEEEIFQEIKRRYSREELSLKTYYAVLKATGVSSLNVLTGEDGDTEIMDFIADETLSNVEDSAILESESAELHHIMKEKLRPKEYDVMVLRYGMFGNTPHTLQEVAEVFGCTRERIRQIEQRAMERLQTAYKIPYNKKVTYLKDMRSIKAIFEGIFINEPDISYLDAKNKLSEKYKNKIDDNDIFQCYEEAKDNLEEYRQLA